MNYYLLLDVPYDATNEQIIKAYRHKAHVHHPDKGGRAEVFKHVNAAKRVLTDPEKRSVYDIDLISKISEYVYTIGTKEYFVVDKEKTGTGHPKDPLKEGTYVYVQAGKKVFIKPKSNPNDSK
jgi:DnaJ-class molecular chaperone